MGLSVMKKFLPHIALLMASIVCLVSLSSCDDDDDYYPGDFLTSYDWELVAVNGLGISEMDVVEFQFFDFGDGTYGRYNQYGNWQTFPIQWDTSVASGGAEYLSVYLTDGQVWDYLMRTYGGRYPKLELTDLATGDVLTFEPY